VALQLIDQAPVWLTVAAATLTAIVTAAFLMSGPVAILAGRTGKKLPEVRGGYDAASLKGYVAAADRATEDHEPTGRALYRMELHWDLIFVLLYGLGLVLVVDGTWGRAAAADGSAWRIGGVAVVVSLMVLDWLEDGLLLSAVGCRSDDRLAHPGLVRWARYSTRAKKIALILAGIVALSGSIRIAIT